MVAHEQTTRYYNLTPQGLRNVLVHDISLPQDFVEEYLAQYEVVSISTAFLRDKLRALETSQNAGQLAYKGVWYSISWKPGPATCLHEETCRVSYRRTKDGMLAVALISTLRNNRSK